MLSVECVPLLREECRATKLNSRPYGDPVAAGDDAMEVSFDLEDGVHPEDSLTFDGNIDLTLFGAGSDAGSDVGSLASSLESFATESDAGSGDDLECFGTDVPRGVLFKYLKNECCVKISRVMKTPSGRQYPEGSTPRSNMLRDPAICSINCFNS